MAPPRPATAAARPSRRWRTWPGPSLPRHIGFEWTDLAYQEEAAGNTAVLVFPLCILFVWLTHSAEYESFALSTAIILIVPMCLLCGIAGVWA